MGRFFNVDPLAAKYPYNSTYAFQENKMGLGRELEGLELEPREEGIEEEARRWNETWNVMYPSVPEESPSTVGNLLEYLRISFTGLDPKDPWGLNKIITESVEPAKEIEGVNLLGFLKYNPKPATVKLPEEIKEVNETGKIYRVSGENTSSGLPYIGRTRQPSPAIRGRGANDGRDRSKAEIIDTYNPLKPGQGSFKEQKAIDREGGVKNLDNKRNEVSSERMKILEDKYGNTKHR